MPVVPLPADERERLEALHRLAILDTPREERFDLFVRLARKVTGAPIAAFSLIDAERQWFKAAEGLSETETPRALSFCAHAILTPDRPLVVEDALEDRRFADNPVVRGPPGIRFYAGVPVLASSGHAVGALCVVDQRPRRLPPDDLDSLRAIAQGVSEALRAHETAIELKRLACTDRLTGVRNRTGFEQALGRAMAHVDEAPVSVLCLDLDRFKQINDLLGHAGGDAALIEAARRIVGALQGAGEVGRLGGDEFAVLVPHTHAEEVAGRILLAFAEPAVIEGQPVALRTSIGLATAPRHGRSPVEILAAADAALFHAKAEGRGTLCRADAGSARPAICPLGRSTIARALRDALADAEAIPFSLAWQPIAAAVGGRVNRFEALLRWPQGDGSALPPGAFLPIAERNGLMPRLDRWVLAAACREAASWWRAVPISVNFSAATFLLDDPARLILRALGESGLDPGRLTIEITETVVLHDAVRVREQIAAVKALGVSVALDDFGAGHATFAYLRDFPFDRVKIDRGLTSRALTDGRAIAVLKGVVALIRDLGGSVTAEGIETEEQAALMRRLGVDSLQGWLLGRPGPIPEAIRTGAARSVIRAA